MKLRLKILTGFLILTVMLLLAGAVSIYELRIAGFSVKRLLDDNYKSIAAAKIMLEALEREDSGILLLLSGHFTEGSEILDDAHSLFNQGYETASANVTLPGESEQVKYIHERYESFRTLYSEPIPAQNTEERFRWYFSQLHPAFLNVKSAISNLMAANDAAMYDTAVTLQDRARRAMMPGIVMIVSALVLTLVFNYLVNIYIVKPIVAITRGIRDFIEVKKPLNVSVDTRDELYDLSSSIQDMMALSRNSES